MQMLNAFRFTLDFKRVIEFVSTISYQRDFMIATPKANSCGLSFINAYKVVYANHETRLTFFLLFQFRLCDFFRTHGNIKRKIYVNIFVFVITLHGFRGIGGSKSRNTICLAQDNKRQRKKHEHGLCVRFFRFLPSTTLVHH